jgi:Leucine-rich repeat (LRR) protein
MLQCGLSKLPLGVLQFTELQSLELEKNNFKTLFSENEIKPEDVNMKSLTYLNVNGNQLTEIPFFIKFVPSLRQIHLHMNKIVSVKFLCRSAFEGLETIDLGGNKIEEIPISLIHFLKNLCQLTIINNDVQKLPNLIG